MKSATLSFLFFLCCPFFSPGNVQSQTVLTLEQAVNYALQANRSLLNAGDLIQSALYAIDTNEAEFALQVRPAASAGLSGGNEGNTTESYGLGLAFSRRTTWGTEIAVTPRLQRFDASYDGAVTCDISQPLFRGVGKDYTLSGLRAAEHAERSARRQLYISRVQVMLNTVQSVYDIIRADEEVKKNQESLDRLALHLAGLKAKSRSGHGDSMDLYRAELEVQDAEETLNASREIYEDAKDALKVVLALPIDEDIEVSAPLTYEKIKVDEAENIAMALEIREEIRQAEDALAETERLSLVAGHNMKPQLDLHLYYSKGGSSDIADPDYGLDEERWGVSLSSSTDFFRRSEKLAYRQSALRVNGSRRNLQNVRDNVVREVKKECRNLRKAIEQIELQQERLQKAFGKQELAKVKFRWGRSDNFSFIESEKQLRQTETNLVGAIVRYIVATYRLRAAIGTLLDKGEG